MKRKEFMRLISALPFAGINMNLKEWNKVANIYAPSEQMPVLFLGHGSPMNAIEENEFVEGFRNIAKGLPRPTAIVCVSAHWETKGTWVTGMEMPKTIHDFGGFPKKLYEVEYPAKGNPALAHEIKNTLTKTPIGLDDKWGLDHGAWSVIKHLYPDASIPVVQLSLDYRYDAQYHYDLAKELAFLRTKGVLIVGSGNMVHNLGMLEWTKMEVDNYGLDWAIEAREKMNGFLLDDNHSALIDYRTQGKAFQYAIPTPEHYLPMLYALALKGKNESIELFNDKYVAGSLTMTSFKIS